MKHFEAGPLPPEPMWRVELLGFMDTSTLEIRTREESTMAGHHPPYPRDFRQQIIELVRIGRTPAELAREFESTATTIRK